MENPGEWVWSTTGKPNQTRGPTRLILLSVTGAWANQWIFLCQTVTEKPSQGRRSLLDYIGWCLTCALYYENYVPCSLSVSRFCLAFCDLISEMVSQFKILPNHDLSCILTTPSFSCQLHSFQKLFFMYVNFKCMTFLFLMSNHYSLFFC